MCKRADAACICTRHTAVAVCARSCPRTEREPGAPARAPLAPALPRSLELPTDDFQQNVTLTALKRKQGGTAIIVQEVAVDSASAAAGVRPGQQLLGLSDTLRSGEVWELNGAWRAAVT